MGTKSFKSGTVRASVRRALGTAVAVPLLFSALPAVAQSESDAIAELRQQIQELEGKINEMEQKPRAASNDTGPIRFGNTEVKVGGYFKVDAFYDLESDNGGSLGPSDALAAFTANGTDDPGDEHFGTSINQSRLTVSTRTPTANGEEIGVYFEGDLYGNGGGDGSVQPRARRLYMTYGNWLAGRDWSTFSDFNYGTTLSFYGPQAQLFERQAQLRYTFDLNDSSSLEVALEEPGNTVLTEEVTDLSQDFVDEDGDGSLITGEGTRLGFATDDSGDDPLPDFTFRFKNAVGDLSWQFAGVARKLRYDTPNGEDSTFGWGLDLGATYSLPTGTTLMASVAGGKGIGRYIYAPAGGADSYVDDDGDLEAIERWGAIGTISQELTPKLTTNFVVGYAESEDLDDAAYLNVPLENLGDLGAGARHDSSTTYTANLLYTPVDPLTVGVEYFRAEYDLRDGPDLDANRIQASAIYSFF